MAKKKFWQLKAQSDTGTAELLLYGEISSFSWWGDEVTPKQFKDDLDALGDVNEIKVFINSGGGDVFAGQAIHSMLKRHKAKVTVYVDGLAASIASVIAMAGDTIYMPRNALMMIHNPWTWGSGTAKDFRKLADDMDKAAEGIIATYEDKAGLDRDKITELMDAETWMTAEEAKEYGFIDSIENDKEIAASMSGNMMLFNGQKFDTSKFKNVPKSVVRAKDMSEEECICQSCSHGDNCQNTGAKCCVCSNCPMVSKCSKPGSEGCVCKDCTMAQTNCCQPGSESCMCDTCQNIDCKKGQMEASGQPNINHVPKDEQLNNEVLSLYLNQVQINKNKVLRR